METPKQQLGLSEARGEKIQGKTIDAESKCNKILPSDESKLKSVCGLILLPEM